jgi:hypothetical protein
MSWAGAPGAALSICAAMPGGSRRAGRRPDKDGDTEGDHPGGRIRHQILAGDKSAAQGDAYDIGLTRVTIAT